MSFSIPRKQDFEITWHLRRAQEANLKSNNNIKFLLLMHHLLCKQQLSLLQGFRHLHNIQLHPNSINFSDVHPSLTPDLPAPNTQEDKKGCMKALGGEKQRVKHTSCGTQILDWSCCWIPCLCPPQNKPNESGSYHKYMHATISWFFADWRQKFPQ